MKTAFCLTMVLALSGCNMIKNPFGGDNKTRAPSPPMTSVMSQDSEMASPRGTNTSNLFSSNIRDEEQRLDRLERAVQNMRNEFDGVRPSIDRLVAIEQDIQVLIDQLESLTVAQSQPQTAPAPAALKAPQTQSAVVPAPQKMKSASVKAPPVSGGVPSVYNVRFGVHPGKTRMVLDVNAKTSFTTDLDNNEKILVIELPNTQWSGAKQKNVKNPIISSYKVQPMGDNGNMMVVQLKKNTSVTYEKALNALSGSGQRLVIDLTH